MQFAISTLTCRVDVLQFLAVNGFEWVAFASRPLTKVAHQFVADMAEYKIFLKWDFSGLKSSILNAHTFCEQSSKISLSDDNEVFWQLVLKESADLKDEMIIELFCVPQIEEQFETVTCLRRKVSLQAFMLSNKYGEIANVDSRNDEYCECFLGVRPQQTKPLQINLGKGSMKELRKYVKTANDVHLRVFISVLKWASS